MRARLLLLGAALAAFGGSLVAGFHVDDYAIFSDPSPRALAWPHPLVHLLNWLNYQVAGQDPLPYHAVNLLLHLCAVLLAYECLRRLLPSGAAIIAAAIFALHPLQAEAVNYVAMRGIVLASLFCFAALLAWIEGPKWLAAPAFAAAILANAWRAPTWAQIPDFTLGALRLLRLFIAPWGFTIYPALNGPAALAVIACLAIAGALIWAALSSHLRQEALWTLVGLGLLIPTYSPHAGDAQCYLALFAFAAAAGLLLARIPMRAVAVALVAILAAVSLSRTYVWMSDERLWREAMRHAPGDAEPKIQLAKTVRAAEALDLLNHARLEAPHNAEIPAEIGKVLLDERQYDGALDELSRAIALNPNNALTFNNRGVALAALGETLAAAADFERALRLDPRLTEAQENLKRLGVR